MLSAGSSRSIRILIACCAVLAQLAPLHAAGAVPAWHDAVDYTKLKSRLGAALPTGAGVAISIVEAPSQSSPAGVIPVTTSYLVNVSSPEFSSETDPNGLGVALTDGSNVTATGFSGHATGTVGSFFFGNTMSVAPGANNVVNYEANNWLTSVLRYNTTSAPVEQNFRVQNHSWVGSTATGNPVPPPFTEHPDNPKVLRRYDYVIETANGGDGMTAVVGLNNNANPMPYLLAPSYNVIAVGRTDGVHSAGFTLTGYGPGRSKPDIVAPAPSASTATAMVSSAATMLYQTAVAPGAAKNEVIKATLMAGATKGEFPGWTRTATQPLDDTFGAGEVNVYNSYLIQLGGKQAGEASAPIASVGSYGWDYKDKSSAANDLYYNFEIAQGSTASQISVMLAWNVNVSDTNPSESVFDPSESLQNLDLRLYNSTNGFMETMLDQSVSTVDNVEHLYLNSLGPGTYTLKVSGAANWDYGLAWRMTTAFDQPNADFDGDGTVSGGDFLTWQRNYGTLLGATNAQGDADGDGDVDENDLALFKAGAISTPIPPMVASIVAAVPEPAAAGMLLVGVASLLTRRHRRR